MNKLVLLILLVACSSVLAETASDCASLSTKTSCTTNTDCEFATTSTTCTDKCNAFTSADCTTNSASCDIVTAVCGQADCAQYNSNKTGCNGASTTCNAYIDSVAFSCTLNGNALATSCSTKTADKATCEAQSMCTFTADGGSLKQCDYKANQCASKASADCDTGYCTKIAFACKAKSNTPCSDVFDANTCSTLTGCQFRYDTNSCTDNCTQYTTDETCTNAFSNCDLTSYSCADNAGNGATNCSNQADTTSCNASAFCTAVNNNACVKSDAYCTSKDAAGCTDTTNCTANPAIQASCPNKATTQTCNGLADSTTCAGNTGCKWTSFSCTNKTAKKCATTDTSAACSDVAKFCTFTETGTCSVASTSSGSIIAISLFAILALI